MPRPALVLATALVCQLALAGAARATAGMVCDALDDSGSAVEMNLPRSEGTPPNWVRVHAPGRSFSTLGIDDGAIPASIRQAFDDGRTFNVDLTDDSYSDAVVKIRLLIAEEGDEPPVYIGYLHVVGQGIYPISCIEDE